MKWLEPQEPNFKLDFLFMFSTKETFDASEKKKMFVIFMTDGHDTCNSSSEIMASKEKLQVKNFCFII